MTWLNGISMRRGLTASGWRLATGGWRLALAVSGWKLAPRDWRLALYRQ
jgi:hypothetical protein